MCVSYMHTHLAMCDYTCQCVCLWRPEVDANLFLHPCLLYFNFFKDLFYVFGCLLACVDVCHLCAWCHGSQKRVSDPLRLDFQMF